MPRLCALDTSTEGFQGCSRTSVPECTGTYNQILVLFAQFIPKHVGAEVQSLFAYDSNIH